MKTLEERYREKNDAVAERVKKTKRLTASKMKSPIHEVGKGTSGLTGKTYKH